MLEISALLSSAKTTLELLSTAISARDDAKIQAAQIEVRKKLQEALDMSFSQIQAKHGLELEAQELRTKLGDMYRRNQELEHELEQRRAYKLAQPGPGKWAYLPVEDDAGPPETTAYFCAACKAEHREVPLQYKAPDYGVNAVLVCPLDRRHALELGGALPHGDRPLQDDPFASY